MGTNLRLSTDAAAALRKAAKKAGRSQQDLLREAVDRYLGLSHSPGAREAAVASGLVRPPTRFTDSTPIAKLPRGISTLDLLDRDEDR